MMRPGGAHAAFRQGSRPRDLGRVRSARCYRRRAHVLTRTPAGRRTIMAANDRPTA